MKLKVLDSITGEYQIFDFQNDTFSEKHTFVVIRDMSNRPIDGFPMLKKKVPELIKTMRAEKTFIVQELEDK